MQRVKPMSAPCLPALLIVLSLVASAAVAGRDGRLCGDAAAAAAARSGVPLPILTAIMRAESGRAPGGDPRPQTEPWPWTLNAGGAGAWFATRAEALARAEALVAEGETNVDFGCFQVNLHWHGSAFGSLDAMLDPQSNAAYAASFLADLYRQTGDWRAAAALYHSRDPDRAEAYVLRLEALHAGAAPAGEAPTTADPRAAIPAAFALTRASGALLTAARGPLIGAP